MKFLWNDLRYGSLRKRYSGIVAKQTINGEVIFPYEKIDDFRLWGVVVGELFFGIMTRRRGRVLLGKHEEADDTGTLRGEA